jgi:hypothetical protein
MSSAGVEKRGSASTVRVSRSARYLSGLGPTRLLASAPDASSPQHPQTAVEHRILQLESLRRVNYQTDAFLGLRSVSETKAKMRMELRSSGLLAMHQPERNMHDDIHAQTEI